MNVGGLWQWLWIVCPYKRTETTSQELSFAIIDEIAGHQVLVRLVDFSEFTGRAVEHDFGVILDELRSFSEDLADKPMIVVASKTDACQDPSRIEAIRRKAESANMEFLAISSVTGTGLEDLRFSLRDRFFKAERVIAAATLSPQTAPDPIRNH